MKILVLSSNYNAIVIKVFFITILTFIYNMNAYSISWGSFIQRNGNDVTIQWGWQNEDSNSIICYNPSGCIVTVGPYDYRGSSADSKTFGGINLPYGMQQKVIIRNNGTAIDAFNAWRLQYGTANTQTLATMWGNYPNTDFASVCYGFQVFQISTWGTSYGTLLPNAGCGVVPPSNTSCNFSFPTSIDLGSSVSGQNGSWSGEATGAFTCTDIVDVRASLLATPYLSNLPVDISVNQTTLDSNNKLVARGQMASLNFKAATAGKFTSAGKFNANAVILFSFN
ncbi:hypothetical protein ACON3F_08555 [Providencia hangzhouensis]|uniref:Fimbrial protein n=1 Tax=Providencia rettgeri TaxID=587 RepID=A0AAE2ZHB3_PRORE|nr:MULTISPECIES: hypothetical protein [Providencia]MBG5893035.1 hypothetical protein [Providencia rettgeri]MBI6190418.1 hypothetical protein [Providencia rettgeri]MBQ0531121.1 hypothetical protein [Providencia rettgeri]MBW3117998.1 hypothetical protein [Providencia rettgeri]MCK9791949.1 hypothetical protein [Providencia rettgeri]